MSAEPVRIPVDHPRVDSVGGLWAPPPRGSDRAAILLAHGAGANMESAFMTAIAEGLAARGFGVLRFDYPFMERSRREERRFPPDRAPHLEAAHEHALDDLRERVGGRRILLAGKSLGGRMSSHLLAKGADAAGLVLLGYPLHPPGRPDRLRTEHLPAIAVPALFLQGTRDSLCNLDLLRTALETYGGTPTLSIVEDADHDFKVPKRTGRTRAEVLEDLIDRIARW